LTPLVRNIDYALDWVHMEAGRAIYRYTVGQNFVKIAVFIAILTISSKLFSMEVQYKDLLLEVISYW
jgi:hypothetical protein